MKANVFETEEAYLRAVASEIMREILRAQGKSLPPAMLAKLLGVNTRRLKHFMNGGNPGMKLWNAGESFADGMGRDMEVHVEAVALNVIADTFPDCDRPRIRRALAEAIRPVLLAEGRECGTL